jgi:hypothetical protein
MNQEVSAQEIIEVLSQRIATLEVDKAILTVQVTGLMKQNLELTEGGQPNGDTTA